MSQVVSSGAELLAKYGTNTENHFASIPVLAAIVVSGIGLAVYAWYRNKHSQNYYP